ncbi:hypothetical protein [Pseudomonas capsici]|uniref:Chemotaxis protein n=1 Tax=Pseudomonas capsici TaxID=2810614 RepID=A0ABT3BW71_9PSED|nr:hypothetical protein [Pseudomonas capsici]MCV4268238.1 hypothetical protein [Pseudomonas capsici]MCV4278709.1 hypothetical protein [Pseudomonas capsici]MCV4331941.1 hypothetical protein [Pseudomonas capsici]MCV4377041.1 hypothetical protein [Pseudomonas capsici]
MIAIGSQPLNNSQLSMLDATSKKAVEESVDAATVKAEPAAPAEGVKVSLSGLGIQKAAQDKANPNQDIESSGLPDNAQRILKMIRELKQKIAEKQQELQALMADQSMDPQTKQSRVGVLQSTIATLTASLMSASNSLDKLSKNGTLSAEQGQQAAQLAMK